MSNAKMPRSIRVAGRRIRMVSESPSLNTNLMGLHHGWANQITLNSGMADDQIKAIAVHEILHDIDQVVGSSMTEQDVTAFSSVLFAVMRDNPGLIRWLMDWPESKGA